MAGYAGYHPACDLPRRALVRQLVGLDAAETCFLLATGLLLIRRDERCSLTAAIAAALVLTDAWFDVLTSAPGGGEVTAVALAACVEVPVAGLCATLAVRTFPRRGRNPRDAARGRCPHR